MRRILIWSLVFLSGLLGTACLAMVVAVFWFIAHGEPMTGKDPPGIILFGLLAFFFLKWSRAGWTSLRSARPGMPPN